MAQMDYDEAGNPVHCCLDWAPPSPNMTWPNDADRAANPWKDDSLDEVADNAMADAPEERSPEDLIDWLTAHNDSAFAAIKEREFKEKAKRKSESESESSPRKRGKPGQGKKPMYIS